MPRWALVAIAVMLSTAAAQANDDFYAGKTVRIIIGTTTAGDYGAYALLMAQHIGRFIPGKPTVIVQTMQGGGGLMALNHVAKSCPAGRHGALAAACQHRSGRIAESEGAVRSKQVSVDRARHGRSASGRGIEPSPKRGRWKTQKSAKSSPALRASTIRPASIRASSTRSPAPNSRSSPVTREPARPRLRGTAVKSM